MLKIIRWLLIIGILSSLSFTHQSPATPHSVYLPIISKAAVPKQKIALGYYTGSQQSYNAVKTFSPYLNIVSSDVFTVQMDGSITGGDDFGVLAYDKAHSIQTFLCVNNYNTTIDDFDPILAHAAIVTYKTSVISSLVNMASSGGYNGVNIDFENLAYSPDINTDRAAFTSFIHDLAAQLHPLGLRLIISVPHKLADSIDETWSYPFDFKALSQYADYLQLMTYDEHGPWGEQGPVSGADWVDQGLAYATSVIAPSKLLIGLPAYGYDWDITASNPASGTYVASEFSWTDIPGLLAKPGAAQQWDNISKSPSVTYTQNGDNHVAWFENQQSLQAKTALITKYNLAGLSMWSLGQEDSSFWQAIVPSIPIFHFGSETVAVRENLPHPTLGP